MTAQIDAPGGADLEVSAIASRWTTFAKNIAGLRPGSSSDGAMDLFTDRYLMRTRALGTPIDPTHDLVRALQDRPVCVDRDTLMPGDASVRSLCFRHAYKASTDDDVEMRRSPIEFGLGT